MRRYFGPSAFIAVFILIGGRFLLEPLREIPHYDRQGMDPFHAVETFILRKDKQPLNLAFFGSSQSVWDVIPGLITEDLHLDDGSVRNLGSPGGTPFEMWHLVKRNQKRLSRLRCAVVEINPFILNDVLEGDDRLISSLSQHGGMKERMLLHEGENRLAQAADWALPLNSARHSLQSAFLDLIQPQPGNAIFPKPEQRTHPAGFWRLQPGKEECPFQRVDSITADQAARRFFWDWDLSHLQDSSLRNLLHWFHERHIPVLMHLAPVHPEVVAALHANSEYTQSYEEFTRYLASLAPAPEQFVNALDPLACGVPEKGFSDRTHLNELGARIYSKFLAGKIAAMDEHSDLQASLGKTRH